MQTNGTIPVANGTRSIRDRKPKRDFKEGKPLKEEEPKEGSKEGLTAEPDGAEEAKQNNQSDPGSPEASPVKRIDIRI